MKGMSPALAAPNDDHKALEAFVVDNKDLEKLEAQLDQFNIFEAIGAVRQELRHSDFLAFLLDPQQNHGLSDTFLKQWLQRVLVDTNGSGLPITLIDLDVWSLAQMTVQREWEDIDILLEDTAHRLAVIIENKIDSNDHSGQLTRYYRKVQQKHPDWHIIGLYLTPDGRLPSEEGTDSFAYVPTGYKTVRDVLQSITDSRATTLGAEVLIAIKHYIQMIGRHIVSDSEVADLCQRIYQKHRRALDLIFEHRPDRQTLIRDVLVRLIKEHEPTFSTRRAPKSQVSISVQTWEVIPALQQGQHGCFLSLELQNNPDNLVISVTLGPGPEAIRSRLFEVTNGHPPFKTEKNKRLSPLWHRVYSRKILQPASYEDATIEDLEGLIRKGWQGFLDNDFRMINDILNQERWLWEPDAENGASLAISASDGSNV